MKEVRTIKASEADAFLELLCRVFALDPGRARGVFFSEPLFDLDRKWALFEDGQILSILTTTGLEFGWGRATGIAGVATEPTQQGRGLAHCLIEAVLDHSAANGEAPTILFAQSFGLYQRCGFEVVDEVVRGKLVADPAADAGEPLGVDDVQKLYENWASQDPERLVRTDPRWDYWVWSYRPAESYGTGYICVEPSLVREAVPFCKADAWPVPNDTEWVGLRRVSEAVEAPLGPCETELFLMGRDLPAPVQMFMTDQF